METMHGILRNFSTTQATIVGIAAPTRGLIGMMEAFLRGYLKRGERSELKKAAGVRYAKVFSIWTPAPILLETSKMLREM